MAKRRFQLTEARATDLKRAYAGCKDGSTRTRYQAVRLYGSGYSVQEIMHITDCSRTSLMDWSRQYRSSGIDGLVDKHVGGNRAKLTTAQLEELRVQLHSYTPMSN